MEVVWKQFRSTNYSVSEEGYIRNDITLEVHHTFGIDSAGYYNFRIGNKVWNVHILVAIVFLDFVPCGKKLVIHHDDGNKLNNHKDNLKVITFRANCSIERTAKSSSKYVGVTWCNTYKKWKACIRINKKLKHLGYFKEEIDAHNVYQKALLELS